jgi:hypothetical protein
MPSGNDHEEAAMTIIRIRQQGTGSRRAQGHGAGHLRIFRAAAVPAASSLAAPAGTGWASPAVPATRAGTAPCTVTDQETYASYTSLQAAQGAASPGDTLSATGTTEITKNLTITGGATLDGNHEGSALFIDFGVTATISSLTITGGNSGYGGGIFNDGSLTLTGGSHITGNTAGHHGGGICNKFQHSDADRRQPHHRQHRRQRRRHLQRRQLGDAEQRQPHHRQQV